MRTITIDLERCVGCKDCRLTCPMVVYEVKLPPCQVACPINTDAAGYISLIRQGKYEEALALVDRDNPLPLICGLVCSHPCETECLRGETDEPIAICALKRFVAEYRGKLSKRPVAIQKNGQKVAIVGSGPAGLAAAHDLAKLGYEVSIFESLPVAGGMLAVGIPEYRLPKEALKTEIEHIKELGVDFRLNTTVGKDLTLDSLFRQGYKAILLAIGAHKGMALSVPGEDGLLDCVAFLMQVNLGKKEKLGGKVIVVGGGNAAIDAARTALRLGANGVNIVYRRSKTEMPAIKSEIEEAEHEGVKINYLVAPSRILAQGGMVEGLECIRTRLGKPDASGRKRPIPIPNSEFRLDGDLIIKAVGQEPDILPLSQNRELKLSKGNTIWIDSDSLATGMPGIFAAGDAISGPATVIEAIASGKKAASSIDSYIKGEAPEPLAERKQESPVADRGGTWWKEIVKKQRQRATKLPVEKRLAGFDLVEAGFSEEMAQKEASRCLRCAVFSYIDIGSCLGQTCKLCSDSCWKEAIEIGGD